MISSLGRSPVSVDTGNGPMTVQQEPLPNATEASWGSLVLPECHDVPSADYEWRGGWVASVIMSALGGRQRW